MAGTSPKGAGVRRTIIESREFAEIYRAWLAAITGAVRPGDPWAIVGIKQRGSVLARRLWNDLTGEWVPGGLEKPAFGEVDISLYRDDYHLQARKPQVLGTEIPFGVEGRRILLVDDVLFTGRTVRAAIDLILDFGRPRTILLAVFIDRGHRELPICPDFTGRRLTTAPDEQVRVRCREIEGQDSVELTFFSGDAGR
jgi:pyrimidine operon attenuation protein/uracil phosphoribosyltransferase